MDIVIETTGTVRMVYDESIDLSSIGHVNIRRGSHVEPVVCGWWTADLSPVNGPVLGPFKSRSEAVSAEVDWLERHWLVSASAQDI
jgi:hypothetical protein